MVKVASYLAISSVGRIDREQIRSRINNNDCRTFRPRRPLSTAYRTYAVLHFCTQLTKAFVAETSCNHCYWFCYVFAHDQFARYQQSSNEPLRYHYKQCVLGLQGFRTPGLVGNISLVSRLCKSIMEGLVFATTKFLACTWNHAVMINALCFCDGA